jgi:hypothetical protein
VSVVPAPSPAVEPIATASEARAFIDRLNEFGTVLAVKLYRMPLDGAAALPVLPCLDHEAMLHEGIAPHAAAYVQDRTGDLHEVVYIPRNRRLDVETASTVGECSADSQHCFLSELQRRFPDHAVRLVPMSRLRGEPRVVNACRAQVSLREVLLGDNLDGTKVKVDRLQTISSLMEKESRSASWAARTVMTPFIAVAGFLTYEILGSLTGIIGPATVSAIRYLIISIVGGAVLYWGVKAVHLTAMANRVWKRSTEYNLVLQERRRIAKRG